MNDEENNLLDPLLEKVENFGKTSMELLRLKAIDKTSDVVSSMLPGIVTGGLLLIFILFLSLGVAFWLGEIWDKQYYLGFLAVALFYGLIGIIIFFIFPDRIKESIRNTVIKQLLK